MRNHLLLASFFCLWSLHSQKSIQNQHSDAHKHIRGTKISLIPPADFSEASNFNGFQHAPSNSSIMVMDIPGPFSEISAAFTKENMRAQGVELDTLYQVQIGDIPGLLLEGTQQAYGTHFYKRILLFGSDEETILINGIAPEADDRYKKEIKKALETLVYEVDKQVDPYEALAYTIDPSGNQLKLAKVVSNSVIYTPDGLVPTKSEDPTLLVVSQSYSKTEILNKKQFAINRVKQTPYKVLDVDSAKEVSVNGIEGIEIYATGKNLDDDKTSGVYQLILFHRDTYYILVGSTESPKAMKRLADLKKIADSFRLK